MPPPSLPLQVTVGSVRAPPVPTCAQINGCRKAGEVCLTFYHRDQQNPRVLAGNDTNNILSSSIPTPQSLSEHSNIHLSTLCVVLSSHSAHPFLTHAAVAEGAGERTVEVPASCHICHFSCGKRESHDSHSVHLHLQFSCLPTVEAREAEWSRADKFFVLGFCCYPPPF